MMTELLSPKMIEAKRERAVRICKIKWGGKFKEYADDFGSYCVLQWIQGRGTLAPYKSLLVDYLRAEGLYWGTTKTSEAKTKKQGSADALNHATKAEFSDALHGGSTAPKRDDGLMRDPSLHPINRAILLLTFQWGLTQAEIADVFGLTPARISQLYDASLDLVLPDRERINSIVARDPNATAIINRIRLAKEREQERQKLALPHTDIGSDVYIKLRRKAI